MLKRTLCAGILLASSLAPVSAQDASARIVARYRQLLEANPSTGTALDRLWKIYQDRSATAELLEIYRKDETFAGQMLYGLFSEKAGQPEIAAQAFAKAAEIDPKKTAPRVALANLATRQGDPKEAADQLSQAVDLLNPEDPSLPDILLQLGNSYAAAGESGKAAAVWERTVNLDAGNIQLRRQLAESYESNDLPERAIPHYRYIRNNGDVYERAMALRDLARVYQVLGDEDAAIKSLEDGISLTAPGNWLREELQAQLIRLHQRYDRVDDLTKKWQRAVEKNPRDLGVYLQLLALYHQLGEQTKQRELLEKLVDLSPRNLDYKIQLAKLVEQAGDSARAAILFDEVLEAQPGNIEAALTRASIELREGKVREADDRVEAFLADHPDDETARSRAMEFFSRHRLYDNLERHLREMAHTEEGTLALCRFLFERGREEEARLALSRFVDSTSDPDKRAHAFRQIAQLYRDQADFPRAIDSMANAARLHPDSAEAFLALGDLYVAAGNFDQAKRTIEKAYDLAENDASRNQADQALFQAFQADSGEVPDGNKHSGKRLALLDSRGRINLFAAPLPGSTPVVIETVAKELAEFVNSLVASAERSRKVEDWLRAAIWQMRIRRFDLAMQAAASALEIDSESVAARQAIVKIATTSGLTDVTVKQLKLLAEQDPENADRYQKQLADLQRVSGEVESALRLYQSLLESNPGDIDCIADLALTMQQIGRWDQALMLWRKAYALSSPGKRQSVIPPLVHALERSGYSREAANLLLESVDSQEDESLRLEAFRDLLAFATENSLVEWLRNEFESRHRRRPNDYFIEVALSRILKSKGLDRESFELLRTAAYAAPDPVKAFEELAQEAEAMGRVEAAIEAQKRLIMLRGDENPSSLRELAEIQTRALEIDDAHETWKRLVARYPRDSEILQHSAVFFSRWRYDEDATAVLRTARVLYPNDVASLMQLARIAARSGRDAEALSCYDQILRTIPTPDRASDEDLIVPDVPETDERRLQRNYRTADHRRGRTASIDTVGMMRSLGSSESIQTASNAEQRLQAIRGAGRILTKEGLEPQREGWLEEWSRRMDAPRNEKLWAFYFANDKTRTLDLLERMIRDDPDNPYTAQAFIWLALEMKGYDELARWLGNPACRPQDRDLMAIALGQYFYSNPGALDPDLVPALFPPEYHVRQMLWQAAALLANSGHFRQAAILGERVLESTITNRAVYGTELARWYLTLGDKRNAKRLLEASIRGQTGDTPNAPVFEALRW